MSKIINVGNPDAGLTQYDGNRADEMFHVTKELLANATTQWQKAIYAMELFNIHVEQLMQRGLDCYDGGSACYLNGNPKVRPWFFEPLRPFTVRLAHQMGEGPDVDIEELRCAEAWWCFYMKGATVKVRLTRHATREWINAKIDIVRDRHSETLAIRAIPEDFSPKEVFNQITRALS